LRRWPRLKTLVDGSPAWSRCAGTRPPRQNSAHMAVEGQSPASLLVVNERKKPTSLQTRTRRKSGKGLLK
jgi:hypothetical protein